MTRALALALLLSAAASAAAQDGPDDDRRRRPREEIFRMVDAYVTDNLQAKLGLDDEQLARALPLVRSLRAERRRFAERRVRTLQQMRRMVRAGEANDARAADLMRELRAAEAEEAAAVRAAQEAVDAALTPSQQVRFRILEGEVEHRLREVMARVRSERRNAPGRMRREGPPRTPPGQR